MECDDGKMGRNGMVERKRAAGGTSEIALAHATRLSKTGTFSVLLMTTTQQRSIHNRHEICDSEYEYTLRPLIHHAR
jgi:hypothetical protein